MSILNKTIDENYSCEIFSLPTKNWIQHIETHTTKTSIETVFSNDTTIAWFYLKHLLNLSTYQLQSIFDLIHSTYFKCSNTPLKANIFDECDLQFKAPQTVINIIKHT